MSERNKQGLLILGSMIGHGWRCSWPIGFEFFFILSIPFNGLTSDFHLSHVDVFSMLIYFSPCIFFFLDSFFSLYSFFSLNDEVLSLSCTGFFHDVFDNLLWNEIIVRVTGTKLDINILMLDLWVRLKRFFDKVNLIWVLKRLSLSTFHEWHWNSNIM